MILSNSPTCRRCTYSYAARLKTNSTAHKTVETHLNIWFCIALFEEWAKLEAYPALRYGDSYVRRVAEIVKEGAMKSLMTQLYGFRCTTPEDTNPHNFVRLSSKHSLLADFHWLAVHYIDRQTFFTFGLLSFVKR